MADFANCQCPFHVFARACQMEKALMPAATVNDLDPQKLILGLANRVADQSEILSRNAEKK